MFIGYKDRLSTSVWVALHTEDLLQQAFLGPYNPLLSTTSEVQSPAPATSGSSSARTGAKPLHSVQDVVRSIKAREKKFSTKNQNGTDIACGVSMGLCGARVEPSCVARVWLVCGTCVVLVVFL